MSLVIFTKVLSDKLLAKRLFEPIEMELLFDMYESCKDGFLEPTKCDVELPIKLCVGRGNSAAFL